MTTMHAMPSPQRLVELQRRPWDIEAAEVEAMAAWIVDKLEAALAAKTPIRAVEVLNAAPALLAELRRLRAIEAAAAKLMRGTAVDPWAWMDRCRELKAALAAKGEA
jgi:hypothetical protein